MKDIRIKAADLILNEKVKDLGISRNFGHIFEVKGKEMHTVRIFTKSGKRIISCDCENGSIHNSETSLCSHKIAVIIYWAHPKIVNQIKQRLKCKDFQ